MKSSFLALVTGLSLSVLSFGSMIEFSGEAKTVSASGLNVQVYPHATVKTDKGSFPQDLTGYGIRQKKVVLLKVNVYVAASYVDNGLTLNAEAPLESLAASKVRILKLTLLRSLTGQEIRESFEEALQGNNVDVTAPAFQNLFNQFNFSLKAGDEVTLIGLSQADQDQVVIELPNNKAIQSQGKGMVGDLWKVWFGIPVDSGMKALQEQLVGKVNP